jgi:hypothetical protein
MCCVGQPRCKSVRNYQTCRDQGGRGFRHLQGRDRATQSSPATGRGDHRIDRVRRQRRADRFTEQVHQHEVTASCARHRQTLELVAVKRLHYKEIQRNGPLPARLGPRAVGLLVRWVRRGRGLPVTRNLGPGCGDGAKGPRLFDWAVATLPDTGTAEHGFGRWLLIRQSISNPGERAYYLCYGPNDTGNEELIRVAGARWAVEECFQTAKGQVGLDEYQVGRYDAWYRHITLAIVAHVYLAATAHAQKGGASSETDSSRSVSPRLAVSWHI